MAYWTRTPLDAAESAATTLRPMGMPHYRRPSLRATENVLTFFPRETHILLPLWFVETGLTFFPVAYKYADEGGVTFAYASDFPICLTPLDPRKQVFIYPGVSKSRGPESIGRRGSG